MESKMHSNTLTKFTSNLATTLIKHEISSFDHCVDNDQVI